MDAQISEISGWPSRPQKIPPVSASSAPSSIPPTRPPSYRPRSDAAPAEPWVDFHVGGIQYSTRCATLEHDAGDLARYSRPQPQATSEFVRDVVYIDRDGPAFRHVLNFLRTRKLPKNLPPWERSIVQGEAQYYKMGKLAREAGEIYPLREQARVHKQANPMEHLACMLVVCAALVTDRAEECQKKLDKLLLRWPHTMAIASAALDHREPHKAALLFGFLHMHIQPRSLRTVYLRHMVTTQGSNFFSQGDCGYRLALRGLTEEAKLFVDKAARLHGASVPHVQAVRGKATLLAQNNFVEAERGARNALAQFPDNAAMLSLLGAALYGQGKAEEAEKPLRRVLELNTGDEGDHTTSYILARICLASQRAEEALLFFGQAHAASPYHVETWRLLGQTLCALNRPAEAQSWLERAAELTPGRADILADLGHVLMMQKLFAQSRPYFERASALDAQNATFQSRLSHVCQSLGDDQAAEAHILKAAALAPKNVGIACQHGNLLLSLRRYEQALSRFSDALALEPTSTLAQEGQALALQQYNQALSTLHVGLSQLATLQQPAPASTPMDTAADGAFSTSG